VKSRTLYFSGPVQEYVINRAYSGKLYKHTLGDKFDKSVLNDSQCKFLLIKR